MTSSQNILIIQGHPDVDQRHLGHVLADAYAQGATEAGHTVRRVDVATLDFPWLKSQKDWMDGDVPPSLAAAQDDIGWAEHIVLMYPLWLGDMPAVLKAFLEQIARPGFAFKKDGNNPFAGKGLTGRSARLVVTMGMPAVLYRWYFRAHSVKSLERNVLGFVGLAPIHHTLIGGVEQLGEAGVGRWEARMRSMGAAGE